MEIKSTQTIEISPHCILFGAAKSGKTRQIPTLELPLVCSTDQGLASIREHNLACVECTTWDQVVEFMNYCFTPAARQFKTIVFDDLSEMAALYLIKALKANKDGRKAYGQMGEEVLAFIRKMRECKTHTVVIICKEERVQNERGELLYSPMIPGRAVQPLLPYLFGQIYHMESWTDTQGTYGTPNAVYEVMRCKRSDQVEAGDRSGKLAEIEMANLGAIITKVMS